MNKGKGFLEFRHEAWEDDISRNSLDNAPFENHPPINTRLQELSSLKHPLLTGRSVEEFANRDELEIPCPEDRERYSVNHDSQYWFSGLVDYLKVMDFVSRQNLNVKKYFDFGCASGRVVRHFVAQDNIEEIWCSDINARHIRWLCEFMPPLVKPIANHSIPHLPITDNTFDLITAFSVFTHIDTFETCWLAELRRILNPGGLVWLTVHNEDTWRVLKDEIENENNRLVQSMISVDPDTPTRLENDMPEGRTVYRFTTRGPYRAQVFHSNSYIEKVWGRFFDILEIIPLHHNRQSVVVMK